MITTMLLLGISFISAQKSAEKKAEAVLDKYAAIPTREAGPDIADSMMGELRDALSEYGRSIRNDVYDTNTPLGRRIDREWFRLRYGGRGF